MKRKGKAVVGSHVASSGRVPDEGLRDLDVLVRGEVPYTTVPVTPSINDSQNATETAVPVNFAVFPKEQHVAAPLPLVGAKPRSFGGAGESSRKAVQTGVDSGSRNRGVGQQDGVEGLGSDAGRTRN